MKNVRKIRTLALFIFIIGIGVSSLGFLSDKAQDIPWFLKSVSPKTLQAREAMKILESRALAHGDPGFDLLTNMLFIEMFEADPNETSELVWLSKVEKTHGDANKTGTDQPENYIVFMLSNGKSVSWSMSKIYNKIDRIRRYELLIPTTIIFIAGAVIATAGFALCLFTDSKDTLV